MLAMSSYLNLNPVLCWKAVSEVMLAWLELTELPGRRSILDVKHWCDKNYFKHF
jgi:hypothetical protein